MLVITRRLDEAVRIGPDIEVRVVEVRGSRVKLGIAAPRALSIWRQDGPVAAHPPSAAATERAD